MKDCIPLLLAKDKIKKAQHFADGVDQEERTRMMMMVGSSTDYISLASVGWCYTGLGFFS